MDSACNSNGDQMTDKQNAPDGVGQFIEAWAQKKLGNRRPCGWPSFGSIGVSEVAEMLRTYTAERERAAEEAAGVAMRERAVQACEHYREGSVSQSLVHHAPIIESAILALPITTDNLQRAVDAAVAKETGELQEENVLLHSDIRELQERLKLASDQLAAANRAKDEAERALAELKKPITELELNGLMSDLSSAFADRAGVLNGRQKEMIQGAGLVISALAIQKADAERQLATLKSTHDREIAGAAKALEWALRYRSVQSDEQETDYQHVIATLAQLRAAAAPATVEGDAK